MAALDGLPPLREVIATHGLDARKALGQNFLLDLNITQKVARTAGKIDDATVVEIGPGPGGLTRALLALGAKNVIAIERDSRAIPALEEIGAHYPGRLTIIEGDALAIDLAPHAEMMFDLSPQAFTPPPKVTSTVVHIEPRANPLPCDLGKLEKVTHHAFGQRRKMLRQSLKPLGGEALLQKAGIDASRRAETLTVEEFCRIANLL